MDGNTLPPKMSAYAGEARFSHGEKQATLPAGRRDARIWPNEYNGRSSVNSP
jgi:hypothetical protein